MKTFRLASLAIAVLAAALWLPGNAIASDKSDVAALVNNAVALFNKGDGKAWAALCAPQAPVINSPAPFQFATCADWWSAQVASNKKLGISDGVVTLHSAWQLSVTGNRAYAVYPAGFDYKMKGKSMKSDGILTIALQKTGSRWLMTGWSWAQH